jgi:hypothetical protein
MQKHRNIARRIAAITAPTTPPIIPALLLWLDEVLIAVWLAPATDVKAVVDSADLVEDVEDAVLVLVDGILALAVLEVTSAMVSEVASGVASDVVSELELEVVSSNEVVVSEVERAVDVDFDVV